MQISENTVRTEALRAKDLPEQLVFGVRNGREDIGPPAPAR